MKRSRQIAPLFLVALLSGCIAPMPQRETLGAVPEAMTATFRVGQSTRADVLLALGMPTGTRRNGNYLIYKWPVNLWDLVLISPEDADRHHFGKIAILALGFSDDGVLTRYEHFEPRRFGGSVDAELNRWIRGNP